MRSDSEEAKWTHFCTEQVVMEPKRNSPAMERLDPRRVKERIDMQDPSLMASMAERQPPMWQLLRIERDEPSARQFKTDNLFENVAVPDAERPDPRRPNDRSESVEPTET